MQALSTVGSGVLGGVSGGAGGAIAGGGKKGGAPPPPDYVGAAERTGQQNRPDQTNAFGSTSTWGVGPDGRPTQTSSFGGPMAGAMTGLEGQFAQANATPMDNGAQARQHAEDAIYGRSTSRLDPRFAQAGQALDANLANSGLSPGDASYDASKANFSREKTDAYQQAQYGAITGGGQEASRQQAMDFNSRMMPLQALQGMQGLSGQAGVNPGANYLAAAGMQGQYGLDAQQMQNQAMADYWKGITGLAGAGAKAAGGAG